TNLPPFLLVLIKTSPLPEEASVVTLENISLLDSVVLSSEPSVETCHKSETKKASETVDEAVCNSTQPDDTPPPKSCLALNAGLLEAGGFNDTGLMMPGPSRRAPA